MKRWWNILTDCLSGTNVFVYRHCADWDAACFAHCLRTSVLLSVGSFLLCAADSCSLSVRNELKLILWRRRSLIHRVFKWNKKNQHFGPPHAESFVLVNSLKGAVGIRAKAFRCKKQKCLAMKGTVKAIFRSTVYNAVGRVTRLPPGRSELRNPAGPSDFLFSEPPRPALGSTHSRMKWAPG